MYLIRNEGKSVVTERLIKTLKTKIYKYIIVNEYNNIYHRTIKMKPVDVKNNANIKGSCTLIKKLLIKISNLRLAIMKEFPSAKIILLKDTHQISLKRFL